MANIRTLNKDKYRIGKHRFRELYYHCLQYDDWKEELKHIRNPLKGVSNTGSVSSGTTGNPTMHTAIRSVELSEKCTVIEAAAKAADPELYEFILYAVTHESISFNFLKSQKKIPCERDRYYNSRRKFYFNLDKMKK